MSNFCWKLIPGFKYYEVSNTGEIRNTRTGKIKTPQVDKNGYHVVILYEDGKSKKVRIARMVGLAFIPNPENKPTINHINGVKNDDRIENLEWATYKEQIRHSIDTGLQPLKYGKEVHNYDTTIYDWFHLEHGLVSCTQHELYKKYNLNKVSISQIVHKYGRVKSHKGWCLDDNKPKWMEKGQNTPAMKDIYTFHHVEHGSHTMIRNDFAKKFNINRGGAYQLCKGQVKQYKGWTIIK